MCNVLSQQVYDNLLKQQQETNIIILLSYWYQNYELPHKHLLTLKDNVPWLVWLSGLSVLVME